MGTEAKRIISLVLQFLAMIMILILLLLIYR